MRFETHDKKAHGATAAPEAPAKKNAAASARPRPAGAKAPWVQGLQAPAGGEERHRVALQRFVDLGLPTTKHEAWRWFPLGHLSKAAFEQAGNDAAAALSEANLRQAMIADLGGPRLVFVDGHLAPQFSRTDVAGLTLSPLATANGAAASIATMADDPQQPFVALNDAFFTDGALVRADRSYADGAPVHLVFVSSQADVPRVSHPRVLIEVAQGAQLHVVQEHFGWATQENLVNVVTEAQVADGGRLHFTKLTHESAPTTHVAALAVQQGRDSTVQTHSFSWGGAHTRNDVDIKLGAEGAHCEMHGLIFLKGEQVADDHTRVHHLKPHTTSVERYRAVLDDDSRGAFAGAVHVAADAQQVNSQQSSRNLLLSDRALMNSKPELQILADDVKCSHGATIGQLDKNALFYLQSRGIDKQEAVRMLTLAFGRAVVDRLPLEDVRQGLTRELFGEAGDVD